MTLSALHYLHEIGGKKNQEDYIWPPPGQATRNSHVFLVCDGVGGAENGEIASQLVAEFIGSRLAQKIPANFGADHINDLVHAARLHLVNQAKARRLNTDMATTLTLLAIFERRAFIAWCGDSRVYQFRNGEILFKTTDHSLVTTLVKKGEITEAEAQLHPQKHIILKAITANGETPEAETSWINDINEGDYFLLCTDGLLENLSDEDLKAIMRRNGASSAGVIESIREKCQGKTRDNYSMYLLQVGNVPVGQPVPAAEKYPKKDSKLYIWLALIVMAAIILYFLFGRDEPPFVPKAIPASHDSVPIRHDTILEPGKGTISDSELLKEDPAGLRPVADSLFNSSSTGDSGELETGTEDSIETISPASKERTSKKKQAGKQNRGTH